ncbi:MAG: thioredoxin fold domain-containing protein [Thioalkalispiraceae bacterium]
MSSVKVSASRANEIQAYEEELPPVTVVKTTDLKSDGRLSRNTQKPILIMFSMEGCGYCQFVEEEHLKPMLRNQQYMQKVIIRKIMTDSYDQLVDFDGSKISAMDLAMRYRANVTPTVVFLNHQGKQLSKRILGVQNTEFYGGELDNGLEVSLHKIRQQLASAK